MLGIRVVVSFVVQNGGVPTAIVDAMRAHFENDLIQQVVVVSESPEAELLTALPLLSEEKFECHQVGERPSFSTMIRCAAGELKHQASLLCVMNADISFATSGSLELAVSTMAEVGSDASHPAAFCLTRYDLNKSSKRITLKNRAGLPNLVSADCWLFSHPPLDGDFYYCPGQMFCDQFLAHDLSQLNYTLFNPCLDIITVHHEGGQKDRTYYRVLSHQSDNQQALTDHWRDRVAPAGDGYIGLVHTFGKWIKAGYRPRPVRMASGQQRIYLANVAGEGVNPSVVTDVLAANANSDSEIYLLVDNKKELEAWGGFVLEQNCKNLFVLSVNNIDEVVRELLVGSDSERTLFVVNPDLSTLYEQWADYQKQFDTLMISVSPGPDPAKKYVLHAQGLPKPAIDALISAAKAGIQFQATAGPVDSNWLRQHLLEVG